MLNLPLPPPSLRLDIAGSDGWLAGRIVVEVLSVEAGPGQGHGQAVSATTVACRSAAMQ